MLNRVDLRVIGAKGRKPGEASAGLVLPAQIDSVNMIAKAVHVPMAFAPIPVPPEATGIEVFIDRRGVVAKKDNFLFSLFVDTSLDGGNTWGGCHVDESNGQVPMSISMGDAITTGLHEGDDAGQTVTLPPDQGAGRLVRISAGAKAAVDVGVYYQILTDPLPPRQLLKDVHHSVAYDAISATQSYVGVSSKSWTHTNSGTTNLFAAISESSIQPNPGFVTPTATYAGSAMTTAIAATNASFVSVSTGEAKLFGKTNPTTGAQTAALAWSGNTATGGAISLTYTGVDQTAPIGNTNTVSSSGSNNTTPAISSATGNMVVDTIVIEVGASALSSSQTLRYSASNRRGCQDAAGAASVSMGWSWTTSEQYVWVGGELLIASTATRPVKMAGESGGFAGTGGGFAG